MKYELVCNIINHKEINKMNSSSLIFSITYSKTGYFFLLEMSHYQIHCQCRKINPIT